MNIPILLLILLFVNVAAFLVVDVVVWLSGKTTLSRWIINNSKRDRWFGRLVFLFIVLFAALLIYHFELHQHAF